MLLLGRRRTPALLARTSSLACPVERREPPEGLPMPLTGPEGRLELRREARALDGRPPHGSL